MNGAPSLQESHAAVTARIRSSCLAHGRDPGTVALLAVSKTFPHSDVLAMAATGQRAFGENYLQEALDKIAACRAERPETALEWHFIGPIQSNKTRPIAEHFDWVHSVEREKIAQRLSDQRPASLAPLQVCLQVNVSGEASKSGCAPDEAPALAERIAALPRLRLRGLMAIPEPTEDVALQRRQFAAVRAVFEACRARGLDLDTLSMGMSADLDAAIAEGATIVRVGTALFGHRPRKDAAAG
jgi:pyridoxal phosphate enzyme (YggS family)